MCIDYAQWVSMKQSEKICVVGALMLYQKCRPYTVGPLSYNFRSNVLTIWRLLSTPTSKMKDCPPPCLEHEERGREYRCIDDDVLVFFHYVV